MHVNLSACKEPDERDGQTNTMPGSTTGCLVAPANSQADLQADSQADSQAKLAKAQAETTDSQAKMADVQDAFEKAKIQIGWQKAQLKKAQAETTAAQDEKSQLKIALAKTTAALSETSAALTKSEAALADKHAAFAETAAALDAAEARLASSESRSTESSAQQVALQERCRAAISDAAVAAAKAHESGAAADIARKRLASATSVCNTLIEAVQKGQKSGAYTLEEAANIFGVIKRLQSELA